MKTIGALTIILLATGCASQRASVRPTSLPKDTRIYFEFAKSTISKSNQQTLETIAKSMKKAPKTALILEGHTDSIGSTRSNEILAETRARRVRVALRDLGVDSNRTFILSKGKRQPAVPGKSAAARKKNRRVEVIYTFSPEEAMRRNP